MAKDPAFLFYYDRFLSGTFTMSDAQVGQYIRLLCLQANKGHVTKKDMNNICKTYDEDISDKFSEIDQDKYANPTLTEIMNQRKVFTESRRNNRKGKKQDKNEQVNNICESHDNHMVNKDVNINLDVGLNKDVVKKEKKTREKFVPPTLQDVREFAETEMIGSKILPEKFYNYYESNGWKIGSNSMKNWKTKFKSWSIDEKDGTYKQPISRQSTGETKTERDARAWEEFGKDYLEGRRTISTLFGFDENRTDAG
jgi:hypothetical protein